MANVKIDKSAIKKWLQEDEGVRKLLITEANKVKAEMQATASSAENGAGGNITGYAAAGFEVDIVKGKKRMSAIIYSKAPAAIAMAVHFYTQRRDGVGHIRAALYRFTTKMGVVKYSIGKNYATQFGESASNSTSNKRPKRTKW